MCSSQKRVIPGLDKGSPERVCKVCYDLINIEEAERLSRGPLTRETTSAVPSKELSESTSTESSSGTSAESAESTQRSCPLSEDFLETVVPVTSSEISSWSGSSFSSSSSKSESVTSSEESSVHEEELQENAEETTLHIQKPEKEKRRVHQKKRKEKEQK